MRRTKLSWKGIGALMLMLSCAPLSAEVTLPRIFTDNMVLQQNTEAPLWGKAKAGKKVRLTTSWDGQTYVTEADEAGKWRIDVKTPTAGGPYDIRISDGKTTTLSNVLIGEVWLCSGQSNMDMPVNGWGRVYDYEQEVSAADYPHIRLIDVQDRIGYRPEDDIVSDGWEACSPTTISRYSAVGYFFGRKLHQDLQVPVGLIVASWGGTAAEAWTSAESLQQMPDFKAAIEEQNSLSEEEALKLYEQRQSAWDKKAFLADTGLKGETALWTGVSYDDRAWEATTAPAYFEAATGNFDGIVWYRKTIEIPAAWQGKELELHLGTIDDNDWCYFNGRKIGATNGVSQVRVYRVPQELVKAGKAVIAVRVEDTVGDGGIYGDAGNLYLTCAEDGQKLSLAGEWKIKPTVDYRTLESRPQYPLNNPNRLSALYNGMLHPIIPYALQGAIWYQGEANELRPYQYRDLFPLMIQDWRKQWQRDFPFYFVQLAAFRQQQLQPAESGWAELREAQTMTLRLENTGMAVTTDIGDAHDIHPRNKQEVGRRLALHALNSTYGLPTVCSGPMYQSYRVEGHTIRIRFCHTADGLKTADGTPVKGFAIAGPDHQFHWAEAVIEGSEIVVSSPEVEFPAAVRYNWADNPVGNLFNSEGLPAVSFRTDDWR